jgi:hypothetical protein
MQLLPILVAVGVGGMTAILVLRLLDASIERQVAAFAHLVGGYRGDGWPLGVQEEDRDRPWGRSRPSTAASHPAGDDTTADDPAAEAVQTTALRPLTRLRD